MSEKTQNVVITKKHNNSSKTVCNKISFNDIINLSCTEEVDTSINNVVINKKEYYLDKVIQKYIDARISLIDIIKKEAPNNKELQNNIIETYTNLIKLNITTILEDDKINNINGSEIDNEDFCNDDFNIDDCNDVDEIIDNDIDDCNDIHEIIDDVESCNDCVSNKIQKLREDLQTKYLNASINELDISNKIILKGPTGFGKIVINYKLIDNYNEDITLIITPRRILNDQTLEDKYKKFLKKDNYVFYNYSPSIGTISKGRFIKLKKFIDYNYKHKRKIIILACYASCKNLITNLDTNKIKIGLTICDESHIISGWSNLSKEYHKLFFNTDKTLFKIIDKFVFTTATPTPDMVSNPELFGNVIEFVQIYELINSGILCDFETIVKHIDYENKTPDMAEFIMQIMNTYKKRKGVIYVNSQNNAINMYSHFKTLYPTYKTFIYISKNINQNTFTNSSNVKYNKVIFSKDDTNTAK